jgi:hypothetical protein
MNHLAKTAPEDTALAIGDFAQSTVVPIANEPMPRLTVEAPLPGPLAEGVVVIPGGERTHPARGRAGCAQPVSSGRPSAHHSRRPAVAVGGLRSEQQHCPGGHAAWPAQGVDPVGR